MAKHYHHRIDACFAETIGSGARRTRRYLLEHTPLEQTP